MCGIFFHLVNRTNEDYITFSDNANIDQALSRRGPDAQGETQIEYNEWKLNFIGHVLWTQGSKPFKQPLVDSFGNILLWNGDLFKGKLETENECDSVEVLRHLANEETILNTLTQIVGPFSFVYWEQRNKCLWFGRDAIGRHSLLWDVSSDNLILSSTGNRKSGFKEVPAKGIFMVDLQKCYKSLELKFYPWGHYIGEVEFDTKIPVEICETISHSVIGNGEKFQNWFEVEPDFIPPDIKLYQRISSLNKDPKCILKTFLSDTEVLDRVNLFTDLISNSVGIRVSKQPGFCKNCTKETGFGNSRCPHAKIGVLFSGGLDSTVVAFLANRFVDNSEPIELYNVAFQNPLKKNMNFHVPDRKTGMASLEELKKLCPERKWNFVMVNITHEELEKWRHERISHLIYPLSTILDDSLGCALWFASRGQGFVDNEIYQSSARIVLLGMGVDEMLGGYSRHRVQWKREKSWSSLGKSLANDLSIIGHRNLGRDNRVVSDHGIQPRLPYLDEEVVAFIQNLPPWKRCYLSDEFPQGVGDKLLLRLTAMNLGMNDVATFPKRAMQFGSRIANSNENGNNISNRLIF